MPKRWVAAQLLLLSSANIYNAADLIYPGNINHLLKNSKYFLIGQQIEWKGCLTYIF